MRNKPMKTAALLVLLFIFLVLGTVVAIAISSPPAHAAEKNAQKKPPAFHFENKHFSLDCTDRTPNACKQVERELRDIDTYRDELREYRKWKEEMNQGFLSHKIHPAIADI